MKYSYNDRVPLTRYKRIMADKYQRGEVVPWWKGLVKFGYGEGEYLCAPLGFHFIYRSLYNLWVLARLAGIDSHNFYQEQLKLRKKSNDR